VIDVRGVPARWRELDVTVQDLPLAVLLAVASLLPALRGHGTQVGDLSTRPFDPPAVAVVALECLPLAVRRSRPAGCLALVSLGFAVDQLSAYHTTAGTALPIALLSAAAHLDRYRWAAAVAVSVAYLPLAVALDRGGSAEGISGFVTFYLAMVIFWSAGVWLRRSRAAEAERRRQVAAASRTAERIRIARELHDVVTHHVTAMVVQAEAARYLTGVPERLDQTLTAVTSTGRLAIADLRELLDLLNPDHTEPGTGTEPATPPVGELRVLVEQTRRAGQPVEFVEEGTPRDRTGSAEVAAYRVVQEALTNALKHAHGARTLVDVQHGAEEITVQVSTEGPGSPGPAPGGSGRGLTGLRARIDVLGGEFGADRGPGGRFVVRARIPVGNPS